MGAARESTESSPQAGWMWSFGQCQSHNHERGVASFSNSQLNSIYVFFFLNKSHFCLQVFSDKLLLHDVLARSDRALAVVHDLLGDPPLRQTGRIINMPRYPNFNVCVCVCLSDTQNDREPF